MREKICCFTGHRSIPHEQMRDLPHLLDYQIEKLIVCGVTTFRGGGAIGFDTLAELVVLEKKEKYDFLKLELVLPCRDQTAKWSARDKQIYEYILARADSVRYVSEKYTSGCMYDTTPSTNGPYSGKKGQKTRQALPVSKGGDI